MIYALWVIAICETIRAAQNMIQLAMVKRDAGARDNAYEEFVKSLKATDKEFVEKMLKEFEEKNNGMISHQIDELRALANRLNGLHAREEAMKVRSAIDTIEALSAKVADQNLTHGKCTETHGVCSNLIRRQDVYDALEQYDREHVEPLGYDDYYNGFLQVIGIIPSADAVEVVRCKGCRHRDLFSCPVADKYFKKGEDFCSWGERREDGEDNDCIKNDR